MGVHTTLPEGLVLSKVQSPSHSPSSATAPSGSHALPNWLVEQLRRASCFLPTDSGSLSLEQATPIQSADRHNASVLVAFMATSSEKENRTKPLPIAVSFRCCQ